MRSILALSLLAISNGLMASAAVIAAVAAAAAAVAAATAACTIVKRKKRHAEGAGEKPAEAEETAAEPDEKDGEAEETEETSDEPAEEAEETAKPEETVGEPAEKPAKKNETFDPIAERAAERASETAAEYGGARAARRARIDRSFAARLIQSDGEVKEAYCAVKAELLSYGAKSRISWKHEAFRVGRTVVAEMSIRGKTLCLLLALDPDAYLGTKYKTESFREIGQYEATPCLYRITNERRKHYSADLIADAMKPLGREKGAAPTVDAPAFEETEALVSRGLIRVFTAAEEEKSDPIPKISKKTPPEKAETKAEEISDEAALARVEISERYSDRTKTGIVNLDTLGANFGSGETADLEAIRRRIPGYKKVTYLKVLARGALDKALTVEADEFSADAVRAILAAGGRAIRTRRKSE